MKKRPLLDSATNDFGRLSEDVRARVARYLEAPSAEGWDDINGIIISHTAGLGHNRPATIWQAVIAVDPSFRDISIPSPAPQCPVCTAPIYKRKCGHCGNVLRAGQIKLLGRRPAEQRWTKWPDAMLLARAIRAALSDSGSRPPGGKGRAA